ncbi:N-acetylmuramoyl-L-alanine amidase family protein [Aestuariibaculum sediminum]|uniref:N-acetylmuramoyl-L-alanine amidase n=1 Tax=Aestuariibaculum sediminum TaxID=2770637 RepID=A0A8J6Q2I5_9FLAO|nr:N-acetylmuramoyl-L-alanine amidase [Aestuariibaculum sediminum]MBD0832159.1 N-acetylmuramoyl-L-alanine amidase [Aestuariibaculum sediminum]
MKTNSILLFVSFIIVLTFSSFRGIYPSDDKGKFVVVLDAGHGGHDPGNLGNGYKEKDIALKIVLEVGKIIGKNPDIEVVYTRKTDVFIGLKERGTIANKANANLFVSVHCNAHHSAAHGAETYVLGTHRNQTNFEVAKKENSVIFLEEDYEKNYSGFDPNSPESIMSISLSQEEYLDQSIQLASLIQKKFTNKLKRKNRGVKQAGFVVLFQTVMPSVLVETGFLTYKAEGGYLNSSKGQREMSTAVADAILEYKHMIDGNIGEYAFIEEESVGQVRPDESPMETAIYENITFKIQIAAGSTALDTKPYNFKGLNDISRTKEGSLYKYYYASTSDYNKIKQLEEVAKQKGYTSSFIVAFKDGKRISLTEALKTTAN